MIASQDRYAASPSSRRVSVLLALGVTLLLFATLVAMGTYQAPGGEKGGNLVAITLAGEREQARSAPAKARASQPSQSSAAANPQVAPPVRLPTENTYRLPDGFIQLSRADLSASDIGRMPRSPGKGGAADAAASGGGGSGKGEGPGGAELYNAEWVREPTDAELGGYPPRGRSPGAWALIACRTIANFHVEDCHELDESPRGSGMARGMRQAAWQFLVRPPREGGKPLLGVWVRIRFDVRDRKGDAG